MADLERHIPMAERLGNDPGDAGRMARSFLAAMQENADLRARLAEVEAERDAAEMALDNKRNAVEGQRRRAEAAEARLAEVARVRDWMGENNDDAEYDLVIVALNNILEGGGRG